MAFTISTIRIKARLTRNLQEDLNTLRDMNGNLRVRNGNYVAEIKSEDPGSPVVGREISMVLSLKGECEISNKVSH